MQVVVDLTRQLYLTSIGKNLQQIGRKVTEYESDKSVKWNFEPTSLN